MPAGWGSDNNTDLAPGRYVAQIKDVSQVEGSDFNDKSKKVQQFRWETDVQAQGGDGRWSPHTIYTKTAFTDMSRIKDPQFVPKLCRLVRACGLALPTNAEEARAWDENGMIGLRFGILVSPDPEDQNTVTTKYVTLPASAQVKTTADALEPALAGAAKVKASAADPWAGDE
jgi:hypothetical protein